jgi:hypothetical protein
MLTKASDIKELAARATVSFLSFLSFKIIYPIIRAKLLFVRQFKNCVTGVILPYLS